MEGLTLERLLNEAARGEVVFLTRDGQIRFALVPADEGDDEVCATRANGDLMAYLAECGERAKQRPRKSLQQMRELPAVSSATIPPPKVAE
jgi:antitoxin (DNA-binding transcriptional repressor) of toxin-antitoxin stability system